VKTEKIKSFFSMIVIFIFKFAKDPEKLGFYLAVLIYSPFGILSSKLSKDNKKIIGFSGGYFGGANSRVIYELMKERYDDVELFWAVSDKKLYEEFNEKGIKAYYAKDIRKIPYFLKTNVWIVDIGGKGGVPYSPFKFGSKEVGMYHGVFAPPALPIDELSKELKNKWKNFFLWVNHLDIIFVMSDTHRKIYVNYWNVKKEKIKVTGYPRIDVLVNEKNDRKKIINRLNFPVKKVNILYAPTWGLQKSSFLETKKTLKKMDNFCTKYSCNFIIRLHPAGSEDKKKMFSDITKTYDNFIYLPYERDNIENDVKTSDILNATDILITDWSGTFIEFLLLNRPIIFLDVPTPVKGLFPSFRVGGYKVKTDKDFFTALYNSINNPNLFEDERREIIERLFGEKKKWADGNATDRCVKEVYNLLTT